jgi:nucleoside-diphosphate-sugar epimerase
MWDMKARLNEHAVRHPAIDAGKMSYTLIGCGDFYNQDREKTWCPWTQKDVESYTFHVIGDPDAKADFTHLDDFAHYLVATIEEPEKSENQSLNFPSDTISHNEIARLLDRYSGKKVNMEIIPSEDQHRIIADPSKAPKELSEGSAFPVDFWFMVKGAQGEGRFYRPKSENSNDLFPHVERTTFEKYFQGRFGQEPRS